MSELSLFIKLKKKSVDYKPSCYSIVQNMPFKPKKQEFARTHSEARQVVCCVCGRKVTDGHRVTERLATLVRQFVFEHYSTDNNCHPTGMCSTCRVTLGELEKVNFIFRKYLALLFYYLKAPDSTSRKLPKLLNYKEHISPPPSTRSSDCQPCTCTVCSLARLSGSDYKDYISKVTNPVGQPLKTPLSPPATTMSICSRCFSQIGKGRTHICNKQEKSDKIANLVKSVSDESQAKVASATLHDIAEKQGVSNKRGATVTLKSGHQKLPVKIGKEKVQTGQTTTFTHDDMKKIQLSQNMSDRNIL